MEKEEQRTQRVVLGVKASRIRIRSTGFLSGNNSSAHRLANVVVRTPATDLVHRATDDTLSDLTELLHKAAESPSPAVSSAALRGLLGLMQSSGSLDTVLRVVQVLLQRTDSIGSATKAYGAKLLTAMQLHVNEAVEVATGGSGRASAQQNATFDPDAKSSGIVLSEGNMKMRSNSGSNMYCCVTTGFSTGKAAWEFKGIRDAMNDECICYGLATKPVTNQSYDSSSQLWTIRAYTGQVYHSGTSHSNVTKIHQGDIVRFELDCDAHECRLKVNDTDHGVVFSDLPDKEIFPCIATYSSSREAELIKVECEGSVAEGHTALVQLDELESVGTYAKEGLVEEDGDPSRVSVGESVCLWCSRLAVVSCLFVSNFDLTWVLCARALEQVDGVMDRNSAALYPDEGDEPASVKYEIDGINHECLVGHLGIDDSSAPAAAPVILSVLGDGELLWSSLPAQKPGSSSFFRVLTTGVSTLELKVTVAPGASPLAG